MNEIDATVRTLARSLGKHTEDSLIIIVDPDGTFVYEPISRRALEQIEADPALRQPLRVLFKHRAYLRAKTFGTEEG